MRSRSEPAAPAPPPLTGQIHYLVGGLLAPEFREWVTKDLTGPGWRNRQARRVVLLMLPFSLAFAVLPGQASVRVSIPLALLLSALVMGYATGDYFRNRRLDQYGIERPKRVEEDAYLDELDDEEAGRQRLAVSEAQARVSPQQPRAEQQATPVDDPDDE